eukprot:scaffold28643_cov34-Phaeocystis_antarctica.AAC.1
MLHCPRSEALRKETYWGPHGSACRPCTCPRTARRAQAARLLCASSASAAGEQARAQQSARPLLASASPIPPADLAPLAVARPELDFRLSRASSPRASPVACAVWRPPCHASRGGAHPLSSGSSTRVAR